MPRLIDANKIGERSKQLMERGCSLIEYAALIVNEIAEAPTVDAVEVVRCRDCAYGEVDDADFPNQYLCHAHGSAWNNGEHFCSYGKRKDGDG